MGGGLRLQSGVSRQRLKETYVPLRVDSLGVTDYHPGAPGIGSAAGSEWMWKEPRDAELIARLIYLGGLRFVGVENCLREGGCGFGKIVMILYSFGIIFDPDSYTDFCDAIKVKYSISELIV